MKLSNFFCLIAFLIQNLSYAIQGPIVQELIINAGLTEFTEAGYYTDDLGYINGGLTINFPAGLFSLPPNVTISVRLVGGSVDYLPTEAYIPMLISVSNASVIIRVNIVSNGGTVAEAATNSVRVAIHAIGV
jgi:hypothetical protein